MNKIVIIIFVLTVITLGVLWAYSLGPLADGGAIKANPISLNTTPQQTVVAQQAITFNVYHNKDLAENFYTVKFPQNWQLQANTQAGSYHVGLNSTSAWAELMDVPDNTTLELLVLSQQEPNLKKTLAGYKRLNYQKLTINGSDAYQLTYLDNANYQTIKTYIAGKDHTGVVTLSTKQSELPSTRTLFDSILNSFQWETK